MSPDRRCAMLASGLGAALLVLAMVASPALASPMAPGAQASAAESAYLDRLLLEVNARRARAGTPPLTYASAEANRAVDRYLADLSPILLASHACFHGGGDPVAPGWDYVADAAPVGEPHGEVLACPDIGARWTAEAAADAWWQSSAHAELLYRDPAVTMMACGTFGPLRGGRSFEAIACVTYRV